MDFAKSPHVLSQISAREHVIEQTSRQGRGIYSAARRSSHTTLPRPASRRPGCCRSCYLEICHSNSVSIRIRQRYGNHSTSIYMHTKVLPTSKSHGYNIWSSQLHEISFTRDIVHVGGEGFPFWNFMSNIYTSHSFRVSSVSQVLIISFIIERLVLRSQSTS